MSIFSSWKKKDVLSKKLFNDHTPSPEGVYNEKGELLSDIAKRFTWIHYFLKYKILIPSIKLFIKVFRKKLVSEIPDRPHLMYLKLFNEAFDNAQSDWTELFLNTRYGKNIPKNGTDFNNNSNIILRDMKNIMNTIITYDTAYIELLHMLMVNITNKMNKHYEHRKPNHLMYVSRRMDDIHYFALFPRIDGSKELKEVGVIKK